MKNVDLRTDMNELIKFQNQDVPEAVRETEKILQMAVDKQFYTKFREQLIPQFRSSQYSKSIYDSEGIIPDRLRSFEAYEVIPKQRQTQCWYAFLDPKDPIVKTEFFRYLSNNKLKVGMLALLIIIDVTKIVLSVLGGNYGIGRSTTITLCNLIGSKAGAAIGAAVCSLVPDISRVIGGILGGIIFGFVGTKVGELLCGLFPEVARDPGPPEPDYLQFIYGNNKNFAFPLPNYELDRDTKNRL